MGSSAFGLSGCRQATLCVKCNLQDSVALTFDFSTGSLRVLPCIKRNIGHLCHDEPRDADTKKPKNGSVAKDEQQQQDTSASESTQQSAQTQGEAMARTSISNNMGPPLPFDGNRQRSTSGSAGYAAAPVMAQATPLPLVQQPALQNAALANSGNSNSNQCT
ncbi:hypothetical protein LIA77_03292 [Sarocladium implicatum]|nr:hypothetical protein LIA77_03292 [Sarocladium implicatum]